MKILSVTAAALFLVVGIAFGPVSASEEPAAPEERTIDTYGESYAAEETAETYDEYEAPAYEEPEYTEEMTDDPSETWTGDDGTQPEQPPVKRRAGAVAGDTEPDPYGNDADETYGETDEPAPGEEGYDDTWQEPPDPLETGEYFGLDPWEGQDPEQTGAGD